VYHRVIDSKIRAYKDRHLIRSWHAIDNLSEREVLLNKQCLINFTSNDYLGIRTSQRIKEALIDGANQFGFGSAASPLVSGYYQIHQELEHQFAQFLNRSCAILFGSGYLANVGIFSTLANKDSYVFLDRLCHASIVDGVLLSKAKYCRYPHQDMNFLRTNISENSADNKIIVTESVFSMDGDITDIVELQKIAKNNAVLVVDDAHGIGVLGATGKGICEQSQMTETDISVLVTPLGKAMGSYGAIVSGPCDLMDALRQFTRSYIYSTALPPIMPYATLQALQILHTETWRREKLCENIDYFNTAITTLDLPCVVHETPIKVIAINDNKKLMHLYEQLINAGIWVAAIRPPTVPPNTARIRISLNYHHSKQDIMKLIKCLKQYSL